MHDLNEPIQIVLFILSCLFAFVVFQAILTGWADAYVEQIFVLMGVIE